ncbi:MAG TPA: DUF6531 domain-containing protein [bacterium]|nr:DUF6531 domain-containing protein [bacterium]
MSEMRRSRQLVWLVLFFFLTTFGADLHRAFACGGGGRGGTADASRVMRMERGMGRGNSSYLISNFTTYVPAEKGEYLQGVLTSTGELVFSALDPAVPGHIPIHVYRYYDSSNLTTFGLSRGWGLNYMKVIRKQFGSLSLWMDPSRGVHFIHLGLGHSDSGSANQIRHPVLHGG